VRVGCAGDELEPAGRVRDEEEDIDPPQRERLDRQEITGERAGGLLAQKRPPRLPPAFGCRRDGGEAQHLADRGRRDRKPPQLELAGDPLITPMRVLTRETYDQLPPRPRERAPSRLLVRIPPAPRHELALEVSAQEAGTATDRKSTRLNS